MSGNRFSRGNYGWTTVSGCRNQGRGNLKWDTYPFGGRNRNVSTIGAGLISFYVSEFPDYTSAKDLFELFGCVGKAVEVSISPRRNNRGKRFGFARFVDIEDGRLFAVKLDNIMIVGRKIHVNLPSFHRGLVDGSRHRGGGGTNGVKGTEEGRLNEGWEYRRGAKSFAEVVGGVSGEPEVAGKCFSPLIYKSEEEDKKRFQKAFIGRVLMPGSAYNLQSYMEMEGIFAVRVTPLGGDVCLLEDREEGFIEDLIAEGETWWKSWFSDIKRWEEGMVAESRDVWLRIYGIPVHAWKSSFFVALAEVWGSFLCIDERTAKGDVFDVARILVKIRLDIQTPDAVQANIDGKPFNLVVREDATGLLRSNVETSGTVDSFSSEGNVKGDGDPLCGSGLKGVSSGGGHGDVLVDCPVNSSVVLAERGSSSILAETPLAPDSVAVGNHSVLGSFDEAVSRYRDGISVNLKTINSTGRELVMVPASPRAVVKCSSVKSQAVLDERRRTRLVRRKSLNELCVFCKGGRKKPCSKGGKAAKRQGSGINSLSQRCVHSGGPDDSVAIINIAGVGRAEGSHSGGLKSYGNHSEESDIIRNNRRQWKFLEKRYGGDLWDAMEVLGVVDMDGCGKKMVLRGDCTVGSSENGEGR
ncbi:uncharacterized protein LOC131604483 [Vicia villosa]|uniref:uncharacterized protein LOC131604483 n=1 Tax=Vicia villosa TaxID=3911 RepID=UPI00273C3FBC|nr:uncharacterized protein LOC131604483 [Vicia villosa]